jgi:HSP20 family protein
MRDLSAVQREINRLFDDMVVGRSDEEEDGTIISPVADIAENEDSYTVTAELPGLKKDDIKVTLQNNVLMISGERKKVSEKKSQTFHRIERSYGSFSRTFDLPTAVNTGKIKADYRDGVLVIELPKMEQAKPKVIPVSIG